MNRKENRIALRLSALALALTAWFLLGSVHSGASLPSALPTSSPQSGIEPPEAAQTPLVSAVLPNPTESAVAVPTPQPQSFLITLAGDCTLATNQYYEGTDASYASVINGDWAYPFAETLRYFEQDDFSMVNLECPLTTSKNANTTKAFYFKADPEYVNILLEGSVEFVTLGNNHILDYGQEGRKETEETLREAGIGYAGRDEWSVYTTKSGLKVGVYAVSFGTPEQIRAGVRAVREAGTDFVIAALHWGVEGSYSVAADQKELAHAAVDAGADFVYGSHPHTLQPVEVYNGVTIYYSMGNFTFGGNTDPRDKDTVIVRLILEKPQGGRAAVTEIVNIPCASSGTQEGNNYQPVPYEEGSEEYARTLAKLDGTWDGSDLSISYSYENE